MARFLRDLSGRVAFITGGAQGIGLATAKALAHQGVRVALADLDTDAVEAAATAVGGGAIGLTLDVTDHAAFLAALDQAELRLGQVDVMINNAGIMPTGPFADEPDGTAQRVIDVNFNAALFGSKQVVRRLRERHARGHIINVASGGGWVPGGGGVTYCGSKFAVVGFSQALNWELHGSGIDVSVVAPAIVRTQLGSGLAEVKGLRKIGPEDVAAAIVRAVRKPQFAVWVPLEMGVFALTFSALPYRLRGFLARLTGADKLLLNTDTQARAAYEALISGHGKDVR